MRKNIGTLLLVLFSFCSYSQKDNKSVLKSKAMLIFKQKCNVCHTLEYPKSVFTEENIIVFSKKIYKQVFVREKMPKGDSIKLTDKEKAILLSWLKTQTKID